MLGYLFRSSKTSTAKRNLMVFIRRPYCVTPMSTPGLQQQVHPVQGRTAEPGCGRGLCHLAGSPGAARLWPGRDDVPEVQQQIQRMQAQQQATATGVRAQVQEQPFVQSKP